jgi:hypothetical protein
VTSVKTEQLQAGMVAATDILNSDGMLLLPGGCRLTERHIRILKSWGIPEVMVHGTADPAVPVATPVSPPPVDLPPEVVAEVKARFWSFEEANPAHQELLRLLLVRRARQSSIS